MRKRHRPTENRDKFDVLSAVWVLTCNDPISVMTYKGIEYRLNLPTAYDIESLIQERGELFRPQIPLERLEEWKAEMRSVSKQRPAWVRELDSETSQLQAIEDLSVDDVFRSQFRIGKGKDAFPSPLTTIDWGLQHIERLRKANLEVREEVIKRWQLWSVILLSIINIVVTMLKK